MRKRDPAFPHSSAMTLIFLWNFMSKSRLETKFTDAQGSLEWYLGCPEWSLVFKNMKNGVTFWLRYPFVWIIHIQTAPSQYSNICHSVKLLLLCVHVCVCICVLCMCVHGGQDWILGVLKCYLPCFFEMGVSHWPGPHWLGWLAGH